MKYKAILLGIVALAGALAFAMDPAVYRDRLTTDQLDGLPLTVIKHDAREKGGLATIAFHVKPSGVVTLAAAHLVVRDANTNVITRTEMKVSERHGVPSCIFRLNKAYIRHSQIEFTLDQNKSYHPLMLSLQEALDHFSKSKTGGLADLKKKKWDTKLLSQLHSFQKE